MLSDQLQGGGPLAPVQVADFLVTDELQFGVIETEIVPPETVWRILTDFEGYTGWNPMLRDVHTSLKHGAEVRFKAARPDGGELKLKARITTLQPLATLVWKGGNDLFLSGEHYFRLQALATCVSALGESARTLLKIRYEARTPLAEALVAAVWRSV